MLTWPAVRASDGKRCCCPPSDCATPTARFDVRDCATNAPVSGVLATVTEADGVTAVGSGTTNAGGIATVALPATGTYTVVFSKTGLETLRRHFTATEACVNTVYHEMGAYIKVKVYGCGCVIHGATVQVTQTAGGTHSDSLTTDAAGLVSIYYPTSPGATFNVTVSAPLFQNKVQAVGPVSTSQCVYDFTFGSGITLITEPEYFCHGGDPPLCRDPIPTTLTLTPPTGPPITLTYDGPFSGSVAHSWVACAFTGAAWRTYRYQILNSGHTSGSGPGTGCTTPDGILFLRDHSTSCGTGTLINSFNLPKTSGTAACPVACVCTIFTENWTVSE